MFSGIIEQTGEIIRLTSTAAGQRLAVRAAGYWRDVAPGASVAVDGVCLTVVQTSGDTAEFDVVGETLARSTLGRVGIGSRVNLERSLRADSRIDGHFVQGHVDGVGTVMRIDRERAAETWWFEAPPELAGYLLPKGSIAIDGISLTLVEVEGPRFSVALIPTTLQRTTLSAKRRGDAVNLESDILVRTIVQTLHRMQRGGNAAAEQTGSAAATLTSEVLRQAGFIQ